MVNAAYRSSASKRTHSNNSNCREVNFTMIYVVTLHNNMTKIFRLLKNGGSLIYALKHPLFYVE